MADDHSHSDNKTIKQLASEMSMEERSDFLEKLKVHPGSPTEHLNESTGDRHKQINHEKMYERLPKHTRFFYFLMGLFKGIPAVKVFDEKQFKKLGRKIQSVYPKLFNYEKMLLLSGFYDLLVKLKETAYFISSAMDSSINRDKGNFYVFMSSLEIADVHIMLQTLTSPEAILEKKPNAKETELHSLGAKAMEEAFCKITDTQRNIMYNNIRILNCLKMLGSISFDHLLSHFDSSGKGQTCPANQVRGTLINLNNIFFSLKEPPSLSLLQSLFVFKHQDKKDEQDANMDQEMRAFLASSEEAIETIRHFNRKVPLTQILRCISHNMAIVPQQISGGEDWFMLFRDHWKQLVESTITEFIQQRKLQEVSKSVDYIFKGAELRLLENMASEDNPDGIPLPEAYALAFLRTFLSAVFMTEINAAVRPVLLEGEFQKQENRTEFTVAFSDITRIGEDVSKLETRLSSYGEYGMRYAQVKSSTLAPPIKKKKMQSITGEASKEAKSIIARSIDAASSMANVLGGVLNRDPSGRFSILTNLEKLSGKNPEIFIKGIEESIEQLKQVLHTLKNIDVMETKFH